MGVSKIKRKYLVTLLLLLGIALTMSMGAVSAAEHTRDSTVNYSSNWASSDSSFTSNTGPAEGTTTKYIKVLIYNGEYSIGVCVSGIKKGLDSANANNLVPGYRFTYATSTTITSSKLSGYDVLAMPGGADGDYYVYSGSISGTAIKNFVSSGNGYLGICAGAYSGVKRVSGYYNGWGVAPHVYATRPWVEGDVTLKIEPAGKDLFGYDGWITMSHYNGPAMYASGGSMVTFATYADNRCNSKGLGAIVGDYYGNGRSVIVGPHPELDPKYPDILANLVVWAANKTSTSPDYTTKATLAQIYTAAAEVKSTYESNKALNRYITINGANVSMSQYLRLLVNAVVNLSIGNKHAVTIKPVIYPTPIGTYKKGSLSKAAYKNHAISILTYINLNGRAPQGHTTSLGKIPFDKLVYMYSKVLNYYRVNAKLPGSVTI